MRIAFLSFRYFPFGGLEKDMLRMAECAAKRGHECTIVTGSWEDDSTPDIQNISVEIVPSKGLSNHSKAKSFCCNVKDYLTRKNFDCTIAFNRIPGCDFYFAADNCYAVEMPKKHSRFILNTLPRYRTYLTLENQVFQVGSKTKIFYIAEKQKKDYAARYGTEEERFILLPPGMNPACRLIDDNKETRKSKRCELNIADDEYMFLLLGSNFRQKGGDRAIAALAGVKEDLRNKIKLVFAGADTPDFCKKLAVCYGVEKNVCFIGARKDVPQLLAACDCLLLPARNEAAGSSIVEAISCGRPVICSDECGFAPYAELAGGFVLPLPWKDETFTAAMTEVCLNREKHLVQAEKYARTVDYTRRADCAVDEIENFANRK